MDKVRNLEKAKIFLHRVSARLERNRCFQFVRRLADNMSQDYVGLVAAGIAFYFLMAAFPALAAIISLYGIFSDPNFVSDQLDSLAPFLPQEAFKILADQAQALVSSRSDALSISFLISTMFAVYSATKGMVALIQGFNIAYNEREHRNLVVLRLTAFTLTLIMMVYFLTALTLIAGLPAVLHIFPLPEIVSQTVLWIRWPLLFFTAIIGLEILYYFGPCHSARQWRWISWGSFISTIFWLVISAVFSTFVSNFGNYNEVYGSLSAIVLLLLWFWLSGLMILFGAEFNSTVENKHCSTAIKDQNADRRRPG